jgi:hypothetical protein
MVATNTTLFTAVISQDTVLPVTFPPDPTSDTENSCDSEAS